MDNFYEPLTDAISESPGLISRVFSQIYELPPAVFVTVGLAPFIILVVTRLTTLALSEKADVKNAKAVWALPYWIPFVGHAPQL